MKLALRTFALTLLLAVLVPASALAVCGPAADIDPAVPGASITKARYATLCLLNAERRQRGLGRLRHDRRLALAGLRHARDMVRRDYFSHESPSGRDFVARILSTSYVPSSSEWSLGENPAWGDDGRTTPRAIVRGWMRSPGHRANILSRKFREVGIAIVIGAPVRGVRDAATYATEFGAIRR